MNKDLIIEMQQEQLRVQSRLITEQRIMINEQTRMIAYQHTMNSEQATMIKLLEARVEVLENNRIL